MGPKPGSPGEPEDGTEPLELPYDADRGWPKWGYPGTRVDEMRTEGGAASAVMETSWNFHSVVSCLGCG